MLTYLYFLLAIFLGNLLNYSIAQRNHSPPKREVSFSGCTCLRILTTMIQLEKKFHYQGIQKSNIENIETGTEIQILHNHGIGIEIEFSHDQG